MTIETSGPSPEPQSSPKVQSLVASVEATSRLVVLLAGVSYVTGLLIVNIFLAQYGTLEISPIRTEYVLAGALWLFLVAFTYLSGSIILSGLRFRHSILKSGGTVVGFAVSALVLVLLTTLTYLAAVQQLADAPILLGPGVGWRSLGFVASLAAGALALHRTFEHSSYAWQTLSASSGLDVASVTGESALTRVREPLVQMCGIVIALILYVWWAYPDLRAAIGGGQRPTARLRLDEQASELLNEISASGRRLSEPVQLLFEGDNSIVIAPLGPAGGEGDDPTRAIAIPRSSVLGMVYLRAPNLGHAAGEIWGQVVGRYELDVDDLATLGAVIVDLGASEGIPLHSSVLVRLSNGWHKFGSANESHPFESSSSWLGAALVVQAGEDQGGVDPPFVSPCSRKRTMFACVEANSWKIDYAVAGGGREWRASSARAIRAILSNKGTAGTHLFLIAVLMGGAAGVAGAVVLAALYYRSLYNRRVRVADPAYRSPSLRAFALSELDPPIDSFIPDFSRREFFFELLMLGAVAGVVLALAAMRIWWLHVGITAASLAGPS